ncbi:hypothetical protein Tco_1471244, partial [Tanacetum coccineum]
CITRSSTKEPLSPFKNPKQKFCSRRRLFDTPSLVESNSPEFDHNFNTEEQSEEEEVILFYNGLDVPTRQIMDSKGVIPSETAADAKIAIQEMAEYSHKWHNETYSRARSTETSDGLAAIQAQLNNLGREIKKVNEKVYAAQTKLMAESTKRHDENSNIIKEIRASTNAAIRNQGASIKTLEIQIGQMSKVLQERGFGNVVHTPYRARSTGAYFLKQSLSQDNCKTSHVMIGERHKM